MLQSFVGSDMFLVLPYTWVEAWNVVSSLYSASQLSFNWVASFQMPCIMATTGNVLLSCFTSV